MAGLINATARWIERLKSAQDYVASDLVAAEHQEVLVRIVGQSLRQAVEAYDMAEMTANDGRPWKPDEVELLRSFLCDRAPPTTYGEQDDAIGTISLRLKRNQRTVKRKAVELGLGMKVDYWLAMRKTI